MTEPKPPVRIANCSGFYGDRLSGAREMVEGGPIDVLTGDWLAELTMLILARARASRPRGGFARTFVSQMEQVMGTCLDRGIKVVSNAGGLDPDGCAEAVAEVADRLGLSPTIAHVSGDDLLPRAAELAEVGALAPFDPAGDLGDVGRYLSANAYLGCWGIVDALERGADIVITGRVTDAAVTCGPAAWHHGWSRTDLDALAGAVVAGHVIECSGQATGGNYSRWRDVKDFARIGYPVSEALPDGTFTITKHMGTGGLVNVETVTSQLLYEMGDPQRYLGPDCIADFTSIQLAQDGTDRVKVSGIKGKPPTPTYKVSMSYANGYKIGGMLVITGPDAVEKGRICADVIFKRMEMYGLKIPEKDRFVEFVGTNVCYKGIVPPPEQPSEIIMRVGAKGADKKLLDFLGRELAPLVTGGPPGITGFAAGRPSASEIVGYWPALIDKNKVRTTVTVEEI